MSTAAVAVKAVNSLRNAESSALNGTPSFYTGSGRDDVEVKTKVKGKKKGMGAVLTILLLLFGGGAFLGSSNSLLAPAIEALFTEATDTQYASNTLRFNKLMKFYLNDTGATATTWTGAKKYTKMSSAFKNRLAKQGITVEGSGSGKYLHYETDLLDGTHKSIDISADQFDDLFSADVDFRDSYTSAKRGRLASFFDKIANKLYQKLGISRNLFNSYKQTGNNDVDTAAYKDTMEPKFEGNVTKTNTIDKSQDYRRNPDGSIAYQTNPDGSLVLDPEGNPIPIIDEVTVPGGESGSSSGTTLDLGKAQSMLESITKVTRALNIGCAIWRVGNTISSMVGANEIYQSINYFMGLTENVSKMKAGYGDESALNSTLNFFATPVKTETSDVIKYKESDGENAPVLVQEGAPVESNGALMMLSYKTNSVDTETGQSVSAPFSLERVAYSIFNAKGATFCSMVDITAAFASIAAVAVSIASGGLVTVIGSAASFLSKIFITTAVSMVVSTALKYLLPTMAEAFFTNRFDYAQGKPAGELFARGASAANTRLGRTGSGQSLSSASVATAYNGLTNQVLALDAEVDRKNHSPFDFTNRNTFFGTIAYNILPIVSVSGSSANLTSLLGATSRSIASITNNVYADDGSSQKTYMSYTGTCKSLESIDAVGDIYCNPITTTDPDEEMLNLSPDNETFQKTLASTSFKTGKLSSSKNLECDGEGNCTVIDKSNLARYITYCDGRDSPFGMVDQNILGSLQASSGLGLAGNSLLNSIPIIGDLLTLLNSFDDMENLPWATGQRCVNSPSNTYEKSPGVEVNFWEEQGRYYQRYVEDMRLLEQRGALDNADGTASLNPVVAYEEKYEAEHPLDNSYSGYLARISGQTKEDVEIALAFIDYVKFLDDYAPDTRLAMTEPILSEQTGTEILASFTTPYTYPNPSLTPEPEPALLAKHILYFDLRSRTYTV